MSTRARPPIEQLILDAAREVHTVEREVEPWVYGWSVERYRRSKAAALPSSKGPVGIAADGVRALEEAVNRLLTEPAINTRWHSEEFWGLIARIIVEVSEASDPASLTSTYLRRLRRAEPSLVAMTVSNVSWRSDPCTVADGVIGRLDQHLASTVAAVAGSRPDLASSGAANWIRGQTAANLGTAGGENSGTPIAAVTWTRSQHGRALEDAERWFENVCYLTLLLYEDPAGRELRVPRGAHNRPGVRGLVPDRRMLEETLAKDQHGMLELSFEPFVLSPEFGVDQTTYGFSSDPMPLDELLDAPGTVALVSKLLDGSDAVSGRLRVAARWHAHAHWAEHSLDAALSLGVALDAIIGSRSGLPGRVKAQRFAHLHPDPAARREALTRCNKLNEVRSAVAHGGRPSELAEPNFSRSFASDVRWAASQLVALAERFEVESETALDRTFQALALGEQVW